MTASMHQPRSSRIDALFPHGVPGLWCDLLTHYTHAGEIDLPRMSAHLRFVREHVKGIVVLGDVNTGNPVTAGQTQQVVKMAQENLRQGREFLWVSATVPAARQAWDMLSAHHVDSSLSGLHLTLPQDRPLYQTELKAMVDEALSADFPACMQLPDVQAINRLEPQTLARLAAEHENLLAFVEGDANDPAVKSGLLPVGLFRLRRCENHYTPSLASTGGLYHGLMLASANVFPQQLAQLVLGPALGQWDASRKTSYQITQVMAEAIAMVSPGTGHSPLSLAVRAMDHHMAHGVLATNAPPPTLGDGQSLPTSLLHEMGQLLAKHDLLPTQGYLE